MGKSIILSSSITHGRFLPRILAKKLEKEGIDVLLTKIPWPRDQFFMYPDGKFDQIQKNTTQKDIYPHFAFNGGTFLKGDDFIIGSLTANPSQKQDETHRRLGVSRGHYFDISEELDLLRHIPVDKYTDFFKREFPHIDCIYNIANLAEAIFTYDHPELIQRGEEMSSLTGYRLITLPIHEAIYAAIGFVEVEDRIIIDKRAEKTKKIIEGLGYKAIMTPGGLRQTNINYGSLRCMTAEMPFNIEKIRMIDPKENPHLKNMDIDEMIFYNLRGEVALQERAKNRLYLN